MANVFYSTQAYICTSGLLLKGREDDKLKNRLEDSKEERASVLQGSKVIPQETHFIPSPSPLSFVLVASSERI